MGNDNQEKRDKKDPGFCARDLPSGSRVCGVLLFGEASVRLPDEEESHDRGNDSKRAEQQNRDALLRIHFLKQEVLGADHQGDAGKERYEVSF
jgi:hypothetical protein